MLMRSAWLRWTVGVLLALLTPLLVYLALAPLLALVPVNRDFVPTPPAAGGIPIYLRSNGFHATLVLPAAAPHDWRGELPAAEVMDLRRVAQPEAYGWIAFGWGDRDFMLSTPTWRELRAATSLRALSGLGRGAMHVEYVLDPAAYSGQQTHVSAAQYALLVAVLRSQFSRNAQAGLVRIEAPGYFATDAFYEAVPSYTAFFTCNDWVRRMLQQAGIRTALWAPFEPALFWQWRSFR